MTSTEDLKVQHEEAKAVLADARKNGTPADVAESKKAVDRLYQAIRRATKAAAQPQAPAAEIKEEVAMPTATKKRSSGRKAASNGRAATSSKRAAAKKATSASKRPPRKSPKPKREDFAPPIVLGAIVKGTNKTGPLARQYKGNPVRARHRQKESGTFVSLIDATLDRRFKKYAREHDCRWLLLHDSTGEAAMLKTWEGAWFYMVRPSEWSEGAAEAAREKAAA